MYLDPSSYARFDDATRGRFSGVGMEVAEVQAGLRVSRVFPRSPAARAGIRRGEEIVAVNGRSLAGKSSRVSTGLIRGRPGTTVTLTVRTGERRRQERLRRAAHIRPVGDLVHPHGGGAEDRRGRPVQLHRGRTRRGRAARSPANAPPAPRRILLDLRDNGGGLLSEAVLVSSVFIPEGTIVSTRGRSRPRRVYSASGAVDPPPRAGAGAGQRRQRVGIGDRGGRSAGPPARQAWPACARSARACSRRSTSCPTVAPWTSPWVSTTCPAGATWAAAECARARACAPTAGPGQSRHSARRSAGRGAGRAGRFHSVSHPPRSVRGAR